LLHFVAIDKRKTAIKLANFNHRSENQDFRRARSHSKDLSTNALPPPPPHSPSFSSDASFYCTPISLFSSYSPCSP
jgi:hypothetical protein